MNLKQKAAVNRLQKALDACHEAGLKGGVFDSSMYVWPVDSKPDPYESGSNFFNVIYDCGAKAMSHMNLDGGAGN